jgi:hypothetical protein
VIGDAEYELVMPLVTVKSEGGPHDDESYVAGWEMGRLDTLLANLPASPIPATYHVTVKADNQPQADRIAMKHGYVAAFEDSDVEGWSYMEVTKEYFEGKTATEMGG